MNKYKIIKHIGQGTFSDIFKVQDKTYPYNNYAMKVPKGFSNYETLEEINILMHIKNMSTLETRKGISIIIDTITYNESLCIIMKLHGPSLYELLKLDINRGFEYNFVKYVSNSILSALENLHKIEIIHSDLKPENIVLSEYDSTINTHPINVTLIDYGCSYYGNETNDSIITTRYYRAPEVIMGLKWSYSVDIWSIGCIMFELLTGSPLFYVNDSHDDNYHLQLIIHILGLKYTAFQSRIIFKDIKLNKSLKKVNSPPQFNDLLQLLLVIEPSNRYTVTDALRHPLFELEKGGEYKRSTLHTRTILKWSCENKYYKTKLCRNWQQNGICLFGNRCKFAHGNYELRIHQCPK